VQLDNVGTVIRRTSTEQTGHGRLLNQGIRVRLVKGAYLEPESIAFPKKKDTDANFVLLMQMLLAGESYNAIATHDEAIINATREFAHTHGIPKSHFEFQMLYGVRRDLQLRLAQEGYRVHLFMQATVVSYFMRRLAERRQTFCLSCAIYSKTRKSSWKIRSLSAPNAAPKAM
jgi:proline dehydrogenase